MNLFSSGEISDYIRRKGEDLEQDVRRITDREIIAADLGAWADYLESMHRIDPILVYEDHVEQSLAETKIKTYNIFSRHDPYEPEYYLIDGYCITFTIPFDGDAKLLQLRPNPYMLINFPAERLYEPKGESTWSIVICVEIPKAEMESHLDDMTSYVFGLFKGQFNSLIDNLNPERRYVSWKKDIYPSPEFLRTSIDNGCLYICRDEGRIAGAKGLNHEYNESYKTAAGLLLRMIRSFL